MEFLRDPETWVTVAFIIFVVLAGKPIGRAVAGMLDARAAKIKAQLDEARALRDEAERLLAENQRKQIAAVKEAETILAQAREATERVRREAMANLEAAFARREKMAIGRHGQRIPRPRRFGGIDRPTFPADAAVGRGVDLAT